MQGNTTMVRKINHIKLVLEEDQVPSEAPSCMKP